MNRILHNASNAQKILQLTADTMLLIDRKGICVDINTHSDLWFLQEERLLGKNIFELLPEHTREKVTQTFKTVLEKQQSISRNYRLELKDKTYYFKCIMYPYEDRVLCQYRDITQRSNVRHLLEQANRNLQEIQKVAQIGQWTYNTRENVFHFLGHTGILCTDKAQNIAFEKYAELILKDDLPPFIKWCQLNKEGHNADRINYRVRIHNEIYYVQVQTYQREECPDGSFNIEGYIQNITDIQHRRNDINTLTHTINNVKESIFAAKKDGTLIFVNRQFMQNHGIAENENINTLKIYDIVPDMQTLEAWHERCKEVLKGGSSSFIAHYPLKKNKDVIAFEGMMYNVISDSGDESFWSFAHDISERLRYEAQINRLNQIMDTTIDHLPAGIVVKEVNNDFRYVYRNRESYNRDLCAGNAIGKNDFDYYPTEIAEVKRKEDIEVSTNGEGLHWIAEGKDKDGKQLIFDKRKIRVGGDDLVSPIIISIEWDITEIELMKRELQESKEKAEQSDRMKSTFLANMSHEIRTPLNAILGFSNLIAESNAPEERKSYYEIVEANNERLLKLIDEILDLSKIESGTVEFTCGPVNLDSLCKEVHDAHIFRTPPNVKLIYEPSAKNLMIETDKNRVFQVFSNLIGNACKFTQEGSISYGYALEGNKVIFHVTDTGMGIDSSKVARVFERFAKLNNIAQGTGLGLSICKTIIERLGGEISVSSVIGKGTTFIFSLPYEATQEQSEENLPPMENSPSAHTESPPKETARERKATILIAEDTDSNYDLLNAILGRQYKLIRARDGVEVVMMYDEVKPDLILMDIKMPNLDGLEATKIIRELSSTVPIIAQSAYAYEHDRKAAELAGCNDFIFKPISQKKLKEIINKWLS